MKKRSNLLDSFVAKLQDTGFRLVGDRNKRIKSIVIDLCCRPVLIIRRRHITFIFEEGQFKFKNKRFSMFYVSADFNLNIRGRLEMIDDNLVMEIVEEEGNLKLIIINRANSRGD